MSMYFPEAARAALDVYPPTESNVVVRPATVTSETIQLPTPPVGGDGCVYWTVQAEATAVYVLFGETDAVEADQTAPSGLSGTTVTPDATSCIKIPADQERSFRVPAKFGYMAHISDDTNGAMRIYASGGNGG